MVLIKKAYPLLEYDPSKKAVIEPDGIRSNTQDLLPEYCVLCFFGELIRKRVQKEKPKIMHRFKTESGVYPVYVHKKEQEIAYAQAPVGAPVCAGMLETLISLGSKKFIVCGSAGVLDNSLPVDHLIVPTAAVRDEGTSYHYLPPTREVKPYASGVSAVKKVLKEHKLTFTEGKTWTTDAFFRETRGKILLRKKEGCLTVDMEASALMAVSRFRKVPLGFLFYSGDDVSGKEWDTRQAWDRKKIREKIFDLSMEAVLKI